MRRSKRVNFPSRVLNRRDHFQFSLGELGDFNQAGGLRPLAADHELRAVRHPLHVIGRVVG